MSTYTELKLDNTLRGEDEIVALLAQHLIDGRHVGVVCGDSGERYYLLREVAQRVREDTGLPVKLSDQFVRHRDAELVGMTSRTAGMMCRGHYFDGVYISDAREMSESDLRSLLVSVSVRRGGRR
ncbi:hypothetical protein [Gordonia sp. N1V]|uniref:hypothetical protein n=1 Tax=Gordonia sp. N1V TaxID=3034163 RepID=UPI0023E294D6|nr:hypothetical protein [Gordonia sp. N1V]MDF3280887.1 hypothetical protein [Gordonia sp. N1V]